MPGLIPQNLLRLERIYHTLILLGLPRCSSFFYSYFIRFVKLRIRITSCIF